MVLPFFYSEKEVSKISGTFPRAKHWLLLRKVGNYINGSVMDSYECITSGTVPLKNVMQLNYFDKIRARHYIRLEKQNEMDNMAADCKRLDDFDDLHKAPDLDPDGFVNVSLETIKKFGLDNN